MSDNGHRKNILEKIIVDETRNTAGRLGHFNHLESRCFNKDLSPEEYIEVYEGVLRNVMKICESRLKNSFSKKERYGEKQKSPRLGEQEWLARIDQDPYPLSD